MRTAWIRIGSAPLKRTIRGGVSVGAVSAIAPTVPEEFLIDA